MSLKGTKTEMNLLAAFAGESQARVKYQYYADQAKKDGFEVVANAFQTTSHNELEHAKIWFKLLNDGAIPGTIENLTDAAAGEHYEWSDFYQKFAQDAKDEGFKDIATLFTNVAYIEKQHEQMYKDLQTQIKNGKMFKATTKVTWQCLNCGHEGEMKEAPAICPVCTHPRSFFQQKPQSN